MLRPNRRRLDMLIRLDGGGPFGRSSEILASSHARPDLRGGFFRARVGVGLLMSLPGVSSIAAGWQLCSAPPRYPAFGPRPISNRMHLPDPGRPVRFER
jgi:hypothetical protein